MFQQIVEGLCASACKGKSLASISLRLEVDHCDGAQVWPGRTPWAAAAQREDPWHPLPPCFFVAMITGDERHDVVEFDEVEAAARLDRVLDEGLPLNHVRYLAGVPAG
jgi:hypothetical protein